MPDKAIDLIDEAASRKKIFNFTTPGEIRDLDEKIKQADLDLFEAKRRDNFELCAKYKALRDDYIEKREKAEIEWKEKCANVSLSIGEDEIAEVVGNWTGIPVKKSRRAKAKNLRDSKIFSNPELSDRTMLAVRWQER